MTKKVLSGQDCLKVQQAAEGDEVTVHYEGRLKTNGFKFDSSFDRGEPITFELGKNQVIAGWEQGLLGSCSGQSISLDIPSQLGYGAKGAGEAVPANADLAFNMTLVAVKPKKVKIDVVDPKPCSPDQTTRSNDVILFNYLGYLENGTKFDSTLDEGRQPLEVTIGKIGLIGWDEALKGACEGETRMALIPYELAYGEKGAEGFVPPKSNVVLQIEIINVRSRVLNFLDRISTGGFKG